MANLTREDVLKLAKLARLKLSEKEVEQFTAEISNILQYVEKLQDVDVKGVEPTYQVTGLKNVTRPDEVQAYVAKPEELLKNVPTVENDQIKVKRVLT